VLLAFGRGGVLLAFGREAADMRLLSVRAERAVRRRLFCGASHAAEQVD
jgi:hypothetical protein